MLQMTDIDIATALGSWAGISLLTALLVEGVVRWALKDLGETGRKLWALAIAVVLAALSHLAGVRKVDPGIAGWTVTVIGGLLAGVGSQVAHDKFLNPILTFLGLKKPPVQDPGIAQKGGADVDTRGEGQ